MPSWSDCSNEHTKQPAPLESNALQPMHHHVGGDFALLAAWATMGEGI
jgi:hypothetical protein